MTDKTPEEVAAKRAEVVDQIAQGMKGQPIDFIAPRVVSLLIFDQGNLNKYEATIALVLEAHRKVVMREAAELIRDNQILNGGERGRELRPRIDGNMEGLHYATEILKLIGESS